MNKIDLLKTRRAKLLEAGKDIRADISALTDDGSFVELDAYAFSHSDFYNEDAQGEGVVTGYATINDVPVYVVAQNINVLSGGVSKANCAKIKKCLDKALAGGKPVVYLFNSLGVRIGEGVNVLEGLAEVISASDDLKGEVPQFSIVKGELYGSFALLAANADFNLMTKDAAVAYASPFVISAKSDKNVDKTEVGGVKASKYNSVSTIEIADIEDAKAKIAEILSILPVTAEIVTDTDDDLNRATESLDEKICAGCLTKAVFDNGKFIEMNAEFRPEVKTGIGRIGGISAAAVIFDQNDEGVELELGIVSKIKEFAYFAADNGLPLVTFVNALGIKADMATSNSAIMKEICHLVSGLKCCERIAVVTKKAIGLGYTLFASKSIGNEYSYAFANSKIALFDGAASAAAFGDFKVTDTDKLAEKYSEENADPVNAAKDGYIDNIIEPQFVRAYVISALQTLVR